MKDGWSYGLPEGYATELIASRRAEELRRTDDLSRYEVVYVTIAAPENPSR
jgi:hypothetical protein